VVGSGVYIGRWHANAMHLLKAARKSTAVVSFS